ncbi:MAG: hypothetical protein LBE08_11765 [Bifidobacteriaceae bacterium]|jgi:DNA-binding transcriptional ArsR family regulator|nr:hypothetical protein [Bifidobacteriaceae bacterium]
MDGDGAKPGRPVELTVLARRYEAVKQEVAAGLTARQDASRPGAEPSAGRRDARRIAAERLGAGVSHTTLEKVLWLRRVAFDRERRGSLREAAFEALAAVEAGGPVNQPYQRVRALVLIDDLAQAATTAPPGSLAHTAARRHLKLLRQHGGWAAPDLMRRQARQALTAAARFDQDMRDIAEQAGPAWT